MTRITRLGRDDVTRVRCRTERGGDERDGDDVSRGAALGGCDNDGSVRRRSSSSSLSSATTHGGVVCDECVMG